MTPRKFALFSALFLTTALPAEAAAPVFDTPAPVAFLKDLSSGAILFSRNPDQRMPPASMAKIMTVYVAFDLIKKGELKLDTMATVNPETWRKWHGPSAGSTMFLSPGEQVSIANLLFGIVTLSGNDACVVLAEHISGTEQAFTGLMNRRAREMGLKNSHFGNSNGWPDEGVTYVTARDLSTLAERTIEEHPKLYKTFYSRPSFTWGKTMGSGQAITQANRDPLLGRVAGADGLKTGHTEEAGYGFTGSAIQNGRRLVMVMSGLTGFNQRIEQSVSFMNWGFRAWQAKNLVPKGRKVQVAEVQLGDKREVGLVAAKDLAVTIPAGLGSDLQTRVVYQGPIKAPFKKGDHIADLVVSGPDLPPQKLPLVAEADVGEAGFFNRMMAGVRWLFGLS
jgi:D-alanyl-D-alanine carboxypeptidase (penicillin-binding protein 5/6)